MTLLEDKDYTALTYARHGLAYDAGYYRFSEQAVREVVRRSPNPYLIAAGRK